MREGWFERLLSESGFLQRHARFAGTLARVIAVESEHVPSMAVALVRLDDPRSPVYLLVNRRYFERERQHFAGVLLHELKHVTLGHLHDRRFHEVRSGIAMELAMELSANEGITEPLPPGVFIEDFTTLGIAPGQSTLERYEILRRAIASGQLCVRRSSLAWLDEHRPRSEHGGSASGLGDALDRRTDPSSARNWNGFSWGLGGPTDNETLGRMREAIRAHLRGEAGGLDDVRDPRRERRAKELSRIAQSAHAGQPLRWKAVIERAFSAQRRVRPTYTRPNRRFRERVGEIPGRVRAPPRARLLVAIDTSGSMSADALGRCVRAIAQLSRIARITVLECDALVHRAWPSGAAFGVLASVIGGGDTDYRPVFDRARDERARFDGLVYFTDGKCDVPDESPLETLWVLTNDHPFDARFGSIVRL